jgi:tetratricopeptide (TPR) repeat protein
MEVEEKIQEYESQLRNQIKHYFKVMFIVAVPACMIIAIISVWRAHLFFGLAWKVAGFLTAIIPIGLLLAYPLAVFFIRRNIQTYYKIQFKGVSLTTIIIVLIFLIGLFYFASPLLIKSSIELGDASWPSHYSYTYRGLTDVNNSQYDSAMTYLNQAINQNPKDTTAYYLRGYVYYEQNAPELAIAELTQAIQIDPKFAHAYYQRGLIYEHESKYVLAAADYNKAIELIVDPTEKQEIQERLKLLPQ